MFAATLMLLTPAFASASTLPKNPFAAMDIARVLRESGEVSVRHHVATLRRTGDSASIDEIAMQKLSGPVGDGRYFLVVPFHNAALAEHSALVFVSDGTSTYEVGGFSTKGDHFVLSYSNAIDVTFFSRPSNGKTVPEGGPAPTGLSHLVVSGHRLIAARPRPSGDAVGLAAP